MDLFNNNSDLLFDRDLSQPANKTYNIGLEVTLGENRAFAPANEKLWKSIKDLGDFSIVLKN